MDIAKIRKKAYAKGAEKLPDEKISVPGLLEDEKKEAEAALPAVDECSAPVEESPAVKIAAGVEDQAETQVDEEGIDENTEEFVELLAFSLSIEEYAFRVAEVEEILRLQNITRIPGMPDYMLGITSLRGKIIPVIDLKTRLDLQGKLLAAENPGEGHDAEAKGAAQKKILIIDGPEGLIGAVIDKVIGVVRLPLSEMLQPPGHLDEKLQRFIEGIVVIEKRFISIINSEAAMDIEVI